MSVDSVIASAILLLGYPVLVLIVALTGPHNETERHEMRRRKDTSS